MWEVWEVWEVCGQMEQARGKTQEGYVISDRVNLRLISGQDNYP
ncbi:hypothetical protein [Moorena sp. SIO1F2]|nr:hypothetical protein [Moorena sp. SIO1F2]